MFGRLCTHGGNYLHSPQAMPPTSLPARPACPCTDQGQANVRVELESLEYCIFVPKHRTLVKQIPVNLCLPPKPEPQAKSLEMYASKQPDVSLPAHSCQTDVLDSHMGIIQQWHISMYTVRRTHHM